MTTKLIALSLCLIFGTMACQGQPKKSPTKTTPKTAMSTNTPPATPRTDRIVKTNAEWKKEMGQEEYHVTREKGTERAFTGKYHDNHEKGVYTCGNCHLELFSSDAKFDSGTGWPSFFVTLAADRVRYEVDEAYGMQRTEALCARCDAHLGHVFNDGPKPTGYRYCMNSVSLDFVKK